MRWWTLFSFIGLLCASCSTAKTSIDVLKKPSANVPARVQRVAVASRVDYSGAKVTHYVNGNFMREFQSLSKPACEEAAKTLVDLLNDVGRYQAGYVPMPQAPRINEMGGMALTRKQTQAFCKAHRADAVIFIEYFAGTVDTDGQVIWSSTVDRTYGAVQVPMFDQSRTLQADMYFRMYAGATGEILYETKRVEELYFNARGETPRGTAYQLPASDDGLIQTAMSNAYLFSKDISPWWKDETRTLYVYGSPNLVKSGNLALSGRWEEATDAWFTLTEEGSKKEKERASFNLIVASEMAGDVTLAKQWAEKCVNVYGNKKAQKALENLQKREKEMEEIESLFYKP